MNPIPKPHFSAMPDGLVAGPAAATDYTLTPTIIRNISGHTGWAGMVHLQPSPSEWEDLGEFS
jgi:hypothetical protein